MGSIKNAQTERDNKVDKIIWRESKAIIHFPKQSINITLIKKIKKKLT